MPKDFDDWECDYNTPDTRTPEEREAAVAAEQELQRRFAASREWAAATAPVTVQRDWWRAVARPAVAARDASRGWEVLAGEYTDRHGNPYPDTNSLYWGEYIGWVSGETAPTPEAVAEMVAAWQEACE